MSSRCETINYIIILNVYKHILLHRRLDDSKQEKDVKMGLGGVNECRESINKNVQFMDFRVIQI